MTNAAVMRIGVCGGDGEAENGQAEYGKQNLFHGNLLRRCAMDGSYMRRFVAVRLLGTPGWRSKSPLFLSYFGRQNGCPLHRTLVWRRGEAESPAILASASVSAAPFGAVAFWQEHNIPLNNMAALMRAVEAAYPTTRQTLRQVLYPHQ
jgi:hypothetical protein